MATLYSRVHGPAEEGGSKEAVVVAGGGPTLSHSGLKSAVEDVASKLQALGVKPGQLVSLAYPNSIEFVVLFLGVTRARAVAAPLNAWYTAEEFKFFLEDAMSVLLLLPEQGGSSNAASAAASLGIRTALTSTLDAKGLVNLKLSDTNETVSPSSKPLPLPGPDDVALFLHTSGTTSRPKGVPLTQGNLAASLGNILATYKLSPADRSYLVMPLFHVHGLMAALLAQLAAGGTVILPKAGKFSATSFWEEVEGHGATWYTAVPTMHQILLARHKTAPRENYPSLRFIRSCSASLAKVVLEDLEATFKAPVLEAYAMTEASHQMTSNPLPENGPHKASSVGMPTGIEMAILDDKGTILPKNERGEVCIRGPNVTKGYMNNPKANEEAFAFGWFHTGDQGFLDEDGFLFLTGRLKELINRGGEKISPLEVDAALLTVPGVAEAVAFSAPDAHYGEEVNAAIVPKEGVELTQEGIQAGLKQQLAQFKIPKKIFFLPELPRTATGKIQRRFVAEKVLSTS